MISSVLAGVSWGNPMSVVVVLVVAVGAAAISLAVSSRRRAG